MELKGKIIDFLGDSITYGHGLERQDFRFSNLLKEKYFLASANNYGISGTRIAQKINPNPDCYEDTRDFCSRLGEMDENADVVVVFGGVNDYQHGDAPMGSFDDSTPETFCGALHFLYSNLKQQFIDSKIVVLTPLHMFGDTKKGGRYPEIKEPFTLEDYVNRIKQTANYYGFHILDLFLYEDLDPNNNEIKLKYMPDGIHPNADGHKIIAELLGEFLENI